MPNSYLSLCPPSVPYLKKKSFYVQHLKVGLVCGPLLPSKEAGRPMPTLSIIVFQHGRDAKWFDNPFFPH